MIKPVSLILAALLMAVQFVHAEDFVAGKDYEVLASPVHTQNKNKVEVVELFWWGCGHCYTFETMFDGWKKKQGDTINVVKMPAMWNKTMKLHAQAFYTAKALGILDTINGPFFKALNVDRRRLNSESQIQEFFAKHGVDKSTFEKTFNSFGVTSQVNLAESRARSYRMQGTPEIVVEGKYRVSPGQAGSQARMLEITDFLIAKEQTARAAK
ncbi:Thiol:disulfide interchange protein DsbA [BD1-7 clade bacterium]|uniref:Thiol:disulfide interchange protein n=1 Tax=BD1-7 clade bacterium TaxID=2029982 RepID=A0A5S9QD92_9GAMM|nr:Thiol:disulfide interchange protein DsbA [BD1-7 clade bacterium]